jgi:ATP/maltotriose-dependent transcriptional regulator MalT
LYRGRISVPTSALVFAVCNDAGRAQSLLDEALKLYPKDTIIVSMQTPVIRAEIEKNHGNTGQALELLESVRAYDLGLVSGLMNNYMRGRIYLQQRSGNEAAVEFQKIIDHRGIDGMSPLHALAHLGLARAAALKGDTARGRTEYQDFFAAWKDADADLPVLLEARKEYEQLK